MTSTDENTSTPDQETADPIRAVLRDLVTWSETLPTWQRDALRRLYLQCNLSQTDIDELHTLCLQSHGLLEQGQTPLIAQPLESAHVPASVTSSGPIALKSIGYVQNVNALASDQTLNFSETGLTIIYGDNGSGKSGYGRVLKRACRARDQEPILPNAYSPSVGKPTARIIYFLNGIVQPEIKWQDGTAAHPDLSHVSVFDSRCALVHVDGKNELAYTPVVLQLLQLLADSCREVSTRLRNKKISLEGQIPSFRKHPASRAGTAVNQIILTLSSSTQVHSVRKLSQLSEQDKIRLETLRNDLATDPAKEIRRLKTLKQRVESLVTVARASEKVLLPGTIDELRRLHTVAKEKTTAAQFAATEAFKREPLPQVGSDVWKELWEAAREFSTREAYPAWPFPNTNTDAFCVLCQQPLSSEAANRLKTFETFVQEKVQQAADEAKQQVSSFNTEIGNLAATKENLREAVRLIRDELDHKQICIKVIRHLTSRVLKKSF